MKLSVDKEYLNESIQHVIKAISSRSTLPILAGIKIEVTHSRMTLTASDTDISIQSFIPVEVEQQEIIKLTRPGSVVLPARFFSEIIRKMPSSTVDIEVSQLFNTLIRSGSSEIQILGLDPEEYPLLPSIDEGQVISIPGAFLKTLIKQTSFAVSTNESTPILTGVLWKMEEGKLKLIGCDRHRLAQREMLIDKNSLIQLDNIVISGKTLNELSRIIPEDNLLVDILVSDNQVLFRMNRVLFYTRILDGTYPDTSKLIPSSYETELTVNTQHLIDAVDRAYLLSREEKTKIVRMNTIDDHTIEISSSSAEVGKITEVVEIKEFTGEPIKISFNSKYMLDALKAIDSKVVRIGFAGSMRPIIICPEDDTPVLQLMSPYRTTN